MKRAIEKSAIEAVISNSPSVSNAWLWMSGESWNCTMFVESAEFAASLSSSVVKLGVPLTGSNVADAAAMSVRRSVQFDQLRIFETRMATWKEEKDYFFLKI